MLKKLKIYGSENIVQSSIENNGSSLITHQIIVYDGTSCGWKINTRTAPLKCILAPFWNFVLLNFRRVIQPDWNLLSWSGYKTRNSVQGEQVYSNLPPNTAENNIVFTSSISFYRAKCIYSRSTKRVQASSGKLYCGFLIERNFRGLTFKVWNKRNDCD